jgi:hypothetical protein
MQSLPAPFGPRILTDALLEAPATAARANTLPDTRADTCDHEGIQANRAMRREPAPGSMSLYGPI